MLKPSIQVALLLRIILAFEVFSTVIAITGNGSTVRCGRGLAVAGQLHGRERRRGVRIADPRPVAGVGRARADPAPDAEGADGAMSRAHLLTRPLLYGSAVLLSLWVLLYIYFITLAAFSTQEAVYKYPKHCCRVTSRPTRCASSSTRTVLSTPCSGACTSPRSRSSSRSASARRGLRDRPLRVSAAIRSGSRSSAPARSRSSSSPFRSRSPTYGGGSTTASSASRSPTRRSRCRSPSSSRRASSPASPSSSRRRR